MPLKTDWTLDLDVDAVLRGQAGDPDRLRARSPDLVQTAGQALLDGPPLLRPGLAYRRFKVTATRHRRLLLMDGDDLEGDLVARELAASAEIVAGVVTIGAGLERLASRILHEDPPLGLALDGLANAAVERLSLEACRTFTTQGAAEGLFTSIPLSPGMDGWPLAEGQRQIFRLLGEETAGVALTADSLMLPVKSSSMVLGMSSQPYAGGRSCDFCSLRETCRYQAKYE